MTELRPYPFEQLVRRALTELEREQKLFDLPLLNAFCGWDDLDVSAEMHGARASSPLGPAAGPHTQMAQNIALSWLAGCRVMELKTVQVDDRLQIPRPCIDMQTVGYNVEWSQELRIEESLEEYAKASMLIEILGASGLVPLAEGFGDTLFDLSLGYDLAGIQSPRVQSFIDGMLDATEVIERLRAQLPADLGQFRDLDFETRLSNQVTLSTFHGCPPDEIEGIARHLLNDKGLHCIVKLNPTLLGPERVQQLLHESMGYDECRVPAAAFDEDTRWEEMVAFTERLGDLAESLSLGFGVKFTNTLIVENHRDFFPKAEERMYLSGPPLHVLAMSLVGDFREQFGMRFPVSFSAGIDRHNFADGAAIGLLPITTCSDFLKTGGYRRGAKYFETLGQRMRAVGAKTLDEFSILAYGLGTEALSALPGLDDAERRACEEALSSGSPSSPSISPSTLAAWVAEAQRLNTAHYVAAVQADERYTKARNSKPPKKIGSQLETFDCVACDKCVPVCPNGANFAFRLEPRQIPVVKLRQVAGTWTRTTGESLTIERRVQYANFADFCNDCGNCDVFCPEDGGPYVIKPRFFRTLADWREFAHLDGFVIESRRLFGRFAGVEYEFSENAGRVDYAGPGFELEWLPETPEFEPRGRAESEVDLTFLHLLRLILDEVYRSAEINYLRPLTSPA